MKKTLRRALILTAMLVMMMAVSASADTRQYAAKTLYFPNQYGAGWSNQFTISQTSDINISISISNYNVYLGGIVQSLNGRLTYVLENVYTHNQITLSGKNNNALKYTLASTNVPAGTYSFGVYYSGGSTYGNFQLYFKVYGTAGTGIKIPDSIEIEVGSTRTIDVTLENGGYVAIANAYSSNTRIAQAIGYNNNSDPATLTISGVKEGTATITVVGRDGSEDGMTVYVVDDEARPTLLYSELTLVAGERVTNEVANTENSVKWSSDDTSVARVSQKGSILGVNPGECSIFATTVMNGVTYKLACVVTVKTSGPDYYAYITRINPKTKKMRVKFINESGATMRLYSANSRLFRVADFKNICVTRIKNRTYYNLKDGMTKTLTFTMSNAKATSNRALYGLRFKFRLEGKYYYGRCFDDKLDSQYVLKKTYDSNSNTTAWMYSYSSEEED